MEKTLVILKPDAVKRKLVGEIISRIENKNLSIIHMKTMTIDIELAKAHYKHVSKLPFFNDMMDYITRDVSIVMIIEGENAIKSVRMMMGSTNPFEAQPGTIRGDYGCNMHQNIIHASDSIENSQIEINRFFPEI